MNYQEKFDDEIRETLHGCADSLHAPDSMQRGVNAALHEGVVRRPTVWRKRAVTLVAAAALMVGGAFAGSTMLRVSGHSYADQRMSWDDTAAMAQTFDADLDLPKTLGGFTFDCGNTIESTAELGANTESFTELSVNYVSGSDQLGLYIRRQSDLIDSGAAQSGQAPTGETVTVGGVQATYSEFENLFLPPDAKPTEEQLAAQARGELNIAYGAAQAESQISQMVTWTADGVVYELFGFDLDLDRDGMLALAADLIGA